MKTSPKKIDPLYMVPTREELAQELRELTVRVQRLEAALAERGAEPMTHRQRQALNRLLAARARDARATKARAR